LRCNAEKIADVPRQTGRGKINVDQAHENHNGNKIGHIGYGLQNPLESGGCHGIHHQGQGYGERKAYNNPIDTQIKGIGYYDFKLIGTKESQKLMESYPGAAPDTLNRGEIFKGNLDAVYGNIGKTKGQNRSGNQEQVEFIVL
jgi:hypothetical protein